MPEEVKMSKTVMEGVVNKKKVLTTETKKTMTLKELENDFLDVVYKDVVLPDEKGLNRIYGLPLSVDTLAMYYNKDLINNAGIAEVPKYWDRDFQETVKKMTKQSNDGQIIQSGVALGGARNIEASTDILSVLMMQSGATMMNDQGSVMFHSASQTTKGYNPGLEALEFYTDFANPGKEVYCWNSDLDNSLDMFAEGKLGIMFGYSYHLPIIKSQAPKLNFNVVKLPQIKGIDVNFANYWIETVSHKSKNKDAAWDFLQFATQKEQAKSYLDYAGKPTALRTMVNEQIDDNEIGVFAQQLLTSKSWYRGYDAHAATEALKKMIEETNNREEEIETIMRRAVERVQQTSYKK
jgi:multiple sugar transport system substrate-binding protein